ncbi:zinc ribbon domain-containing protein [Patescibacteria group bacterium]
MEKLKMFWKKMRDKSKGKSEGKIEVQGNQTSRAGFVVLSFMTFVLIIVGHFVIFSIESNTERVKRPSSCADISESNLFSRSYVAIDKCNFGDIDERAGSKKLYESISDELKEIGLLGEDFRENEKKIREANSRNKRAHGEYAVLEEEKVVTASVVGKREILREEINESYAESQSLKLKNDKLRSRLEARIKDINPELKKMAKARDWSRELYQEERVNREYEIFFARCKFLLSIFAIASLLYLVVRKKAASYAVIFMPLMVASGFMLIECVLFLVGSDNRRVEDFFELLESSDNLRYVFYYGVVFLVSVIFGLVAYFIQRKGFSFRNISLKRVRDGKCFSCGTVLGEKYKFCPNCGKKTMRKCLKCGKPRVRLLPFCQNCGKK